CGSKTPPHSRHTATGRPSSPDRRVGPLECRAHTAHRSGGDPAVAPYRAGRRPSRPRAAWPPGYVRLAASARAPRDDTFSPRAHSSSLSKHLGHRSIVCRERNYRLTSPVQQRWPDKPNSLFRGQAPSLRLRHRWLCYGALALLLLAVGKLVVYDYGEVF